MARKRTTKTKFEQAGGGVAGAPTGIVINEPEWQRVRLGMALGLYNVAAAAYNASSSRAPKDRPALFQTGGAGAYLDGKKVAGVGPGGSSETSGARPTAFTSFEFPAHLVELGTTDTPAQPFLVPGTLSVLSSAPGLVAGGMKKAGV